MSTHTPGPWTDNGVLVQLRQQRDELLAALELIEATYYSRTSRTQPSASEETACMLAARAAIASARGAQQPQPQLDSVEREIGHEIGADPYTLDRDTEARR